jgi:3-deoxy-D-manno-octulosonate 8-phosphate phosphatase (KDO 8-P phosphatase)
MSITEHFTDLGGVFITPAEDLKEKLSQIKAFIFDWDGVFNNGAKSSEVGSNFCEPDAMGLNMLKLDYWLRNKEIPYTFIVTGEKNLSAQYLAQREQMHGVFYNCKFKVKALENICSEYNLNTNQIAFAFDDILDVELAKRCGASFLINRTANPLFNQYI